MLPPAFKESIIRDGIPDRFRLEKKIDSKNILAAAARKNFKTTQLKALKSTPSSQKHFEILYTKQKTEFDVYSNPKSIPVSKFHGVRVPNLTHKNCYCMFPRENLLLYFMTYRIFTTVLFL